MEQFLYLKQLFSGGQGWLQVMLLTGLFVAVIFRPQRIHNESLFRISWLCLAFSVMAPAVLVFCVAWIGDESFFFSGSRGNDLGIVAALVNASGPVLLGLSIIFGFLSLGVGPAKEKGPVPPRHPMED